MPVLVVDNLDGTVTITGAGTADIRTAQATAQAEVDAATTAAIANSDNP